MNELLYCISSVIFYAACLGGIFGLVLAGEKTWTSYQERSRARAAVKLRLARSHR